MGSFYPFVFGSLAVNFVSVLRRLLWREGWGVPFKKPSKVNFFFFFFFNNVRVVEAGKRCGVGGGWGVG